MKLYNEEGALVVDLGQDPTFDQFNEAVLQLMVLTVKRFCEQLAAEGKTRQQINESLAENQPRLNQWHADCLRRFVRAIDEPFCPSLTLQ